MIFILAPQGASGRPLNPLCIYHLIRSSWHVDCPFHCAHRAWPATTSARDISNMPFRRLCLLVWIASIPALCLASIGPVSERIAWGQVSLAEREHHVWSSAVHDSEFATMAHPTARAECGAVQPPQALATPDPLLDETDFSAKVSVSFIVGTDGRVHSALILESAGPNEDRTILEAVRFWRYRPALCNGVPTEAEAKVEFSSR
jgi:TonB family protein